MSAPVTSLAEAKQKADPEVVRRLEQMLEFAKSGELLGFVAFGVHLGGGCSHCQAGDTDFSAILVAFEDWKFWQVWKRTRTDEP